MNLPKSFFDPGTYQLTTIARTYLKDFLQNQELSKLRNLVGYTPDPDEPYPITWPRPIGWRNYFHVRSGIEGLSGPPWPEPCINCSKWFNNTVGYPVPDDINPWPWPLGPLVKDLVNDKIHDLVSKSPGKNDSYNFIDVIKKENIVEEVLSELCENLGVAQKEISLKLKALKNSENK